VLLVSVDRPWSAAGHGTILQCVGEQKGNLIKSLHGALPGEL
jgi:hypothetical protein